MQAIRARVVAGEDFGSLARELSDSSSRFRDGRLGWIARGALRPEIDRAAQALETGEVSSIIETKDGLTLLLCEGQKAPWSASWADRFEVAEDDLRRSEVRRWWAAVRETVDQEIQIVGPPCPPPSPSSGEQSLATYRDQTLTISQFESLVGGTVCTRSTDEVGAMITDYFLALFATREATKRGLRNLPEVRTRVLWNRRALLADSRRLDWLASADWEPTAASVQSVVERSQGKLRGPDQVDLEVIRSPFGAHPTQQARQLSALAANQLEGESLSSLADRLPSDSSASYEPLGWIGMNEVASYGRPYWETVKSLTIGETSGVVEANQSFFLVRLRGRRQGAPLNDEEVAEVVRSGQLTRSRAEALEELKRTTARNWYPGWGRSERQK
jgi:hypothetical protein